MPAEARPVEYWVAERRLGPQRYRTVEGQPEEGFATPTAARDWLVAEGHLPPAVEDQEGVPHYPDWGETWFAHRYWRYADTPNSRRHDVQPD